MAKISDRILDKRDRSLDTKTARVRSRNLDTKTQRAKLAQSGKPYFRTVEKGVELGYRKGKRGGKWVFRRYLGNEQYQLETFASADDDPATADGDKVLTFFQAVEKARELANIRKGIAKPSTPLTVKEAIDSYLAKQSAKTKSRLTKHVLADKIASKKLADLTEHDLTNWRDRLPDNLSETTVRRIKNDFRAALNAASRKHRKQLPPDMAITIKDGFANREAVAPTARGRQVLPDADIRRAIAAAFEVDAADGWEGDLARIVVTLAATGARFSQVIRMRVADVQTEGCRLMIPVSQKGRGEKRIAQIAVRVGADVIEALRPALSGRKGSDFFFERWRWRQIKPTEWQKDRRGPWTSSSELTRPWAKIIEKAELASGVVPYSLRHSSIVRGLRAGLPVRLVAALHDTSSAMIEAHYSAFIIDAMDELAARAVVPLTAAPVAHLRPVKRAKK